MKPEETVERIRRLEMQLLQSRYSDITIDRDDAIFLLNDLIRARNYIAEIEQMPIPFPPKVEEPKREINVGFNGP